MSTRENKLRHRLRTRPLGRRFVLRQVDSHASGRRPRGDCRAVRPRFARHGRRRGQKRAAPGERAGAARRPFLWRNTHHRRRRRPACRRAPLHRRIGTRQRRNLTEPAGQVPGNGRFLADRGSGRASLAEERRGRVLRGRSECGRRRSWSGRHMPPLRRISSTRKCRARRGARSRAGTSSARRIAPFIPICSDSSRSA